MRDRIDKIEELIHEDVGRGVSSLFAATKGGLWGAVSAPVPKSVGLFTGFYVPHGEIPAAETDGPAGAALLALAFSRIGVACRVLTDDCCRSACEAALTGGGVHDVPVDSVAPDTELTAVIQTWRDIGVDWALSIERCGLSADGRPYNMRGEDIGAFTAPLDHVFTAGPWRTIAIGDGGNEIGMGALPPGLLAADIPFGETIACRTAADHLIVAGVSHWGVYALIAGLAIAHPNWREVLRTCLDPAIDQRILETLLEHGPAVDGVTLRRAMTIDGIGLPAHRARLEAITALID